MAINTPDNGLPRTGREVTYGGNLPSARLYQQQVDYRPTQISGVEPSSAQSPFAMAMELMGQGSRAFGAYADFKIQQNAAAQHWSNKMTDQQHMAFQQQLVKHKMDVFSSDTGSSEWQSKMNSYDSWLSSSSQSANPKVRLQALNAGLDNLHYSEQVRRSISAQAKQDMRDAGTLQRQLSKQERQRKAAANTTIAGFTPTIEALFTGDPTKNINVPPPQIANDMQKGPQWYSQKYVQIANKLAHDSGQTIDWNQPQISMAVHQAALNMWAKQLDNQTNHQAKMFKASVETANSDYAGNIIHDPAAAIQMHKGLMDNPMVSPQTKSKIQKDFATGSIKSVTAAVSNGSLDPSNALQILNTARGSLPKEYGDEFNKGVDSVYGVISGKVKASFYKDVQQYSSKTNANPAMAAYVDGKIDSYLAGQAVNMGFLPTVANPTNMSQFDLSGASPQMQKLFDQIAGTKATIHKQLNVIDPGFDDKTRNTHSALVDNFTNLSPMPLQASGTQMNQMWEKGSARRQQQSGTFTSQTTAKLSGFIPVELLSKPPETMNPQQKAALAFGMGTYDGHRTAAQGAIPGAALQDIRQIINSDNPHDLEYAAAFLKANGGTYGGLMSRSGLDGKELTLALQIEKYFTPGTNRATTQNLLASFQQRRQQILNAKPLDDQGIRKMFQDRNGTPATKLVAQAFDKEYSTIPKTVMRALQSYIPNAVKDGVSGDPKALLQRGAVQLSKGTGIKIIKGQDHVGSIYDPHDHYSQGFQYRAPMSYQWDNMVPDPTNQHTGLKYVGTQTKYRTGLDKIQPTDQAGFLKFMVHTFKADVLKYNSWLSQYPNAVYSIDWQGSAANLQEPAQNNYQGKFQRAFLGGGGRIKVTIPNADLSNPNSISEFYLVGPNNQPLTMSHRRAGRLSFAR